MLQEHADAWLQLLRDDPDLTVYPEADDPGDSTELVPPDAAAPYVVVHLSFDLAPGPSGLVPATSRVICRGYAHCVGANDIAARAVADRVARAWLDVEPVLPGRQCYPIRFEAFAGAPRSDTSTGTPVVELTHVYRLETLPG